MSEKNNFEDRLIPLHRALLEKKTIKSITCFAGQKNKDNRNEDFTLKNVVCKAYIEAMQSNYNATEHYDYVMTDKRDFYMNWVISFEL
jgi:lipopolysaccharide biosynthesis glycosyltransferase